MSNRIRRLILLLLAGIWAAGCNGSGSSSDSGSDPLPLDERLVAGQVRAGVITKESELIGGPEAQGWLGDYKIYNSRVAFIIENIEQPRGWGPYGGSLLDADIIRAEGEAGQDRLQEVFLQVSMLTLYPTASEVVADGQNGRAMIRISGRDQGIPALDAAIGGSIEPKNLEIVTEYILEADQDFLLIRTTVETSDRSGILVDCGDVVLNGDLTDDFVPGQKATGTGLPAGDHEYLAGVSPQGCNLYTSVGESMHSTFSLHEVSLLRIIEGIAPPERDNQDPLMLERILVLGGGGLDSCLRVLNEFKQVTETGRLSGLVEDSAQEPQAGLELLVVDLDLAQDENIVNQTYTDQNGQFEVELPPGNYQLVVNPQDRGEFSSETVALAAGQDSSVTVAVPQPARLAFECHDSDSNNLPCKLSLQAGHDAAMNDPVRVDLVTFAADGSGQLNLPTGDWTATLSRGWEYNIHRQNVTALAGETAQASGTLDRQVNSQGYIAADLHTHCARSIDSTFEIEDKIAANLAEAVEVVVITDHDCTTDFTPAIEDMKQRLSFDLDEWIKAVSGTELSPHYGHSTVFPMPAHPSGWIYWQVPWTLYEDGRFIRNLEYPEVWPLARDFGIQVVNLAHPLSYNAWFEYLGFDPPNVMPRLDSLPADKFSADFDTFELLTMDDVDVMLEKVLPVWSAMNNQGTFKTAVGVSDAHQRDAAATPALLPPGPWWPRHPTSPS
jgi:carboxypeptidase family protein